MHFTQVPNPLLLLLSLTATTHKAHRSRVTTTSRLSVNQIDNCAVDNIIIRCADDGPSDDRADNYSIHSHHQVIGRRRCRTVTTSTIATNECKR